MRDEIFIEAILNSPQDHNLRLVYADWLEERGDSRGQLLRIIHEMSQAPICSRKEKRAAKDSPFTSA